MAIFFGKQIPLSIARYKGYYDKIVPLLKAKEARSYSTFILSFLAASFFGLFAINPTLTTISELQKKLKDAEIVKTSLEQKINNLVQLQREYTTIQNDLAVVFDALPSQAQPAILMGKIRALTKKYNITLTGLQILEVKLSKDEAKPGETTMFSFSLAGNGRYEEIESFLSGIATFDRIITIETLSISKPVIRGGQRELAFILKGSAYVLFEEN